MAYDNNNRGSIWKNEKKRAGKQDPDFTGTFTDANGVEHWVSAWKRKDDAGPRAPALTWTTKPKDEQPQQSTNREADMDDEIPF